MTNTRDESGAPPPARTPNGGRKRPDEPASFLQWLDWLPWEKILIWGLFLLIVYTLRHFFFIIFLTFIISYIMRNVVIRIARIFSPRTERAWLERSLTLICFALLLFGLYRAGLYLGPKLVAQAKALIDRGSRLNPQQELDSFVTRTVGTIIFQRQYGGRGDPRYEEAFEAFRAEDTATRAYEKFSEVERSLETRFLEQQRTRLEADIANDTEAERKFEDWFLKERAPAIYAADRDRYLTVFEQKYQSAIKSAEDAGILPPPPFEEYQQRQGFEKERDETILRLYIWKDQYPEGSEARKKAREDWVSGLVNSALTAFKASPAYGESFKKFYERELLSAPVQDKPPYPYEKYVALREAYSEGKDVFLQVLQESALETEEQRIARARIRFEYEKQHELAQNFMKSDIVKGVVGNLSPYGEAGLQTLTGWIQSAIRFLLTTPVQLALSLLLSFFITMDMPRIKAGMRQLRASRVREFYEEIAPGLYTFGRLIGRAFQAQGVIAFFNTVLTFLAIHFIGIQNEIFLCAIVFVCSFIPVLGVVLSSVPISIMAIVQPDGSIYMALAVIAAILVIHFIETSILNPKILGDMLHLHPVLVLAVLAIGEHFAGIWGLLLGVPVAVYIIRCVILNEEIPGLIENARLIPDGGPSDALSGAGAFVVEGADRAEATASARRHDTAQVQGLDRDE